MTVEQAIEVEGYNDDPKAYARLLKAAETGYGMHYALADEKRKRQERIEKDRAKAELTLAGVRIVNRPDLGYGSREELLTYLAEPRRRRRAHRGRARRLPRPRRLPHQRAGDLPVHQARRVRPHAAAPDQLSHRRGAGARRRRGAGRGRTAAHARGRRRRPPRLPGRA